MYDGYMDSPAAITADLSAQEINAPKRAIYKLSHRHEQLINWLLQNPEKSLRECADYFNYSQGWVSQIIHSDIFQAQLRSRQNAVFVQVAQDIPTKLAGLADQAIEKVSFMLERSENPDFAIDVFDKALNKLGYAPSRSAPAASGSTQVNVFTISKSELADARTLIAAPQQLTLEQTVDSHSDQGGAGGNLPHPATVSTEN